MRAFCFSRFGFHAARLIEDDLTSVALGIPVVIAGLVVVPADLVRRAKRAFDVLLIHSSQNLLTNPRGALLLTGEQHPARGLRLAAADYQAGDRKSVV